MSQGFQDKYSSEYPHRGPSGFYYKSHLDVPDRHERMEGRSESSSSSDSGCLGLTMLILLVGALITGGGVAAYNGLSDDTPDFRDEARWTGTYECGEETLGLRLVTGFTGPAEEDAAPMRITATYFDAAPARPGVRVGGEELGTTEFTATLRDGVVTLDEVDLDDPEPHEASAGRLRIRTNGEAPDTMSGRLRAPRCAEFDVTQTGA